MHAAGWPARGPYCAADPAGPTAHWVKAKDEGGDSQAWGQGTGKEEGGGNRCSTGSCNSARCTQPAWRVAWLGMATLADSSQLSSWPARLGTLRCGPAGGRPAAAPGERS